MLDKIGASGIFISDSARDQLNITLDEEIFAALKKEIEEGTEDKYKCFVTGQWCDKKDGIFFPPDKMAEAIEKNLQKQEDLVDMFKKEGLYINEDGHKKTVSDLSKSEQKKYLKKITLSFTKKMAMRAYIKMLRGKVRNYHG